MLSFMFMHARTSQNHSASCTINSWPPERQGARSIGANNVNHMSAAATAGSLCFWNRWTRYRSRTDVYKAESFGLHRIWKRSRKTAKFFHHDMKKKISAELVCNGSHVSGLYSSRICPKHQDPVYHHVRNGLPNSHCCIPLQWLSFPGWIHHENRWGFRYTFWEGRSGL